MHSTLITYSVSDDKLVAFQPSVTATTTGSVRNASAVGVLHTQASDEARVAMRFVLTRNTILVQTYASTRFAAHSLNVNSGCLVSRVLIDIVIVAYACTGVGGFLCVDINLTRWQQRECG
jgi:hypothetical protein